MGRKNIVILSMIILIICTSAVSAGFLDGFFPEENDVTFIDEGVEGKNSSDWYYLKNLKVTVTEKGTVLINNGEGNAFYSANKPSTSMSSFDEVMDWFAPYTVEFDLINGTDSAIQLINQENSTARTFEQLGITSNSHVKLVNDGYTVKYYINGISDPIYTYSDQSINQSVIRFVIPENNSLTYKNFTIY